MRANVVQMVHKSWNTDGFGSASKGLSRTPDTQLESSVMSVRKLQASTGVNKACCSAKI